MDSCFLLTQVCRCCRKVLKILKYPYHITTKELVCQPIFRKKKWKLFLSFVHFVIRQTVLIFNKSAMCTPFGI